MRFSAEQAFEASEEGEPIMIDAATAQAIFAQHDTGEVFASFADEHPGVWSGEGPGASRSWDAAGLLGWLGY